MLVKVISIQFESCLYGKPILVLNDRNEDVLVVDSIGRRDTLPCFTKDPEFSAYQACGLTWQNKFYTFGGYYSKRAIIQLSGTHLKNIGSLSFNFYYGGCANMNDQKIFLCFRPETSYQCHTTTSVSEEFAAIEPSNYPHRITRISASSCELIFKAGH